MDDPGCDIDNGYISDTETHLSTEKQKIILLSQ